MKPIASKITGTLVNLLLFLLFFVPFYWMALTSIKTLGQTLKMPPLFWIADPQWQNFIKAYNAIPFLHYLKNSVVVALATLAFQAVTVIPAAYAYARFRFRGSDVLFGVTLATMMIPGQLIFLPVFLLLSKMGLINNYLSLILPFATSAFGIFMLRQTFKQVPQELIEAARLDKAGEFRLLTRVMLPIAKPTLVTLAMLTFIGSWNDYFWPLVFTTNDAVRTLPVGISSLAKTENGINYHVLMAGNVLLIAPVLAVFAVAQKQIIKAFTYMGDK
jgi:sn-glycerol 3-phosphate transport system permease protein